MDRRTLRRRATELYADELAWAIGSDERVELGNPRERAAARLGREMVDSDLSSIWLGYIEGIARATERNFEVDASTGQLRMGGALRVDDLTFVPVAQARIDDWLALDARHEAKLQEHIVSRDREREAHALIIGRLRAHGGDPTTFEACPDLFVDEDEGAA